MKLKGKTAIVTGASTGMGRAIAVELAREGAFVIITARRRTELEKTGELVKKVGGGVKIIPADLSRLETINKFIEEVGKEVDRVDILVNVAGIWHGKDEVYAGKDFESFSQGVILDTLMVGTAAPMLLAHAFVSKMKKGKILNISGTFESGAKGWVPYFVSKKAIEDLTIGLAEELKGKGIQVNCISPSDTATEEYKKHFSQYIKDAIGPEEIAKYTVQLCSDDLVKVTGEVFVMEKGKKPYKGYHT